MWKPLCCVRNVGDEFAGVADVEQVLMEVSEMPLETNRRDRNTTKTKAMRTFLIVYGTVHCEPL